MNQNPSQNPNTKELNGISVLVLDKDSFLLRAAKNRLTQKGAKVHLEGDTVSAKLAMTQKMIHVVLADFDILEQDGFEFCEDYKKYNPQGLIFALHRTRPRHRPDYREFKIDGGFDQPLDYDEIVRQIKKGVFVQSSSVSTLDPLTELLRPFLIFRSPVMRRGLMILPKIAASNHSVLITGETGTGKEMVARAIHSLSDFVKGSFIAVNCGAIPENLIEGELFGHEKGSFTGAQAQHRGKFELAHNGTLFLDEIGEMPMALQARLLRVLEERQFYRVGGEKPIEINVRILAATQVGLEKAVEDGLFREDLYYRLNVLRVHIPALRDRPEDIPLLAWHFLERALSEMNRNRPFPTLSNETIGLLKQQTWKGNVRELRNLMTRLAVLLPKETRVIDPEFLKVYFPEYDFNRGWGVTAQRMAEPIEMNAPPIFSNLRERERIIEVKNEAEDDGVFVPVGTPMKEAEEMIIQKTLEHTDGNRTQAAKILGIGIRTIRRKLNE